MWRRRVAGTTCQLIDTFESVRGDKRLRRGVSEVPATLSLALSPSAFAQFSLVRPRDLKDPSITSI